MCILLGILPLVGFEFCEISLVIDSWIRFNVWEQKKNDSFKQVGCNHN